MIMFKSQHNSDRTVFDAVSIVSWSEIDVSNSISTFVSDPMLLTPVEVTRNFPDRRVKVNYTDEDGGYSECGCCILRKAVLCC